MVDYHLSNGRIIVGDNISSITVNLIICNDILLWMFYVAHVRFNAIL